MSPADNYYVRGLHRFIGYLWGFLVGMKFIAMAIDGLLRLKP